MKKRTLLIGLLLSASSVAASDSEFHRDDSARVPGSPASAPAVGAPPAGAVDVSGSGPRAIAAQSRGNSSNNWPEKVVESPALRVRLQPGAADTCQLAFGVEVDHALEVHPPSAQGTFWLTFVAPDEGHFGISTFGSSADTSLAIWNSCAMREGERLSSSDTYLDSQALASVDAVRAGQRFYIRVNYVDAEASVRVLIRQGSAVISGTVTPAPLPGVPYQVIASNADGFVVGSTSVSTVDGRYSLQTFFDAVRVRLQDVSGQSGFVMQAYPQRPCYDGADRSLDSCGDLGEIELLDLSTGSQTGIDFTLSPGGAVVGMVFDNDSLAPIRNATINLSEAGVDAFAEGRSSEIGRYRIDGLPPGTYYLQARSSEHTPVLHEQQPCSPFPCVVDAGTPVVVGQSTTTVVNFGLTSNKNVRLQVVGLAPGQIVSAFFLEEDGFTNRGYAEATADTQGNALIELFQPPGSARLYVAGDTIISEVYPEIDCVSPDCAGNRTDGALITIPNDGLVEIFAQVAERPEVVGTVLQSSDLTPIEGAVVFLYRQGQSSSATGAATDESGVFVAENVHPGAYLLRTQSQSHIDELFDDVVCPENLPITACQGATVVNVSAVGAQPIEFVLDRSATITGRILLDGQIRPNFTTFVALLNQANQPIDTWVMSLNQTGAYTIDDLPLGNFRVGVYAIPSSYAFPALYDGVTCAQSSGSPFENCPAGASELTLAAGSTTSGVDFDIEGASGRVVWVRRGDNGVHLPGIALDIWSPDGGYRESHVTNANGYARVPGGLFNPAFIMSSSNGQGFVDEVYRDLTCPDGAAFYGLCSLAGAQVIQPDPPGPGLGAIYVTLLPPGSDSIWYDQFE